MAQANRDENRVTTLTAVSNADGTTPLNVYNSSVSVHALKVADATTGTVASAVNAPRDQNTIPVVMAASSADGTTPVTLAVDSITHALLVQST